MTDGMVLPLRTESDPSARRIERLAALFDTHHRRLLRLARRLVDDAEEARDLVQDAFLRAARQGVALPPGEAGAEAWLVRTLVNLCRDRLRRRSVRRQPVHHRTAVEALAQTPADPEAAAVARATVGRALRLLPPRRRAVLVLAELEGLPVERIAALLGITRVTVRWHLAAARADLAAAIGTAGSNDASS